MPITYNVKSPTTGVTHKITFDQEPPPDVIKRAAQQADEPIIAFNRLKQNDQISKLLELPEGSSIEGYSPEQRAADQKAVALETLSREGGRLQKEAKKMEDVSKTGKAESAAIGLLTNVLPIATVPEALAEAGLKRTGLDVNQIFPNTEIQKQAIEELYQRAGVNPISATAGQLGGAVPALGASGTGRLLGQGLYREAAGSALKGAGTQAVLGSGLRLATGGEVTPGTITEDVLLGGLLGGQNPRLNQEIAALPQASKERLSQLIESSVQKAEETLAPIRDVPLVRGIENIVGAGKDVVVGTGRSVVKSFIPKSAEDDLFSALQVGSNTADASRLSRNIKNVGGDLVDMETRSGVPIETQQNLADNALFAKKQIHADRDSLAGQAFEVNYDPLVEAYETVAAKKSVQDAYPEILKQLQERANQWKGKIRTTEDAEELLQVLNAQNEGITLLSGVDRAQAMKSNPFLEANVNAANALRGILEKSLGGEFSELGKKYGAWAQIHELATKQALKQAKIDGNIGLFEGLGILDAIRNTGNPSQAFLSFVAGKAVKVVGSPDTKLKQAMRNIRSKPSTGTKVQLSEEQRQALRESQERIRQSNLEEAIRASAEARAIEEGKRLPEIPFY